MLVGLISDTHGHLGDDALGALAGCECIVHAGDVGSGVLGPLRDLAPVVAVRGNTDVTGEASLLPLVDDLEISGRRLTVVHRLVDAPAEGWDILVYGHCHRTHADWRDGRLLVNPGAAGRRGFHSERSVARLAVYDSQFTIHDSGRDSWCSVEFVDLGLRSAAR